MADNNIDVILRLKDQLTKQLKDSQKSLGDFSRAAGTGGTEVKLLNEAMMMAGGVGALYLGRKVVEAAWNMGRMGAQVLQTRESFQELSRQAGGSGDAIVEAVNEATSNTVSNGAIMASVNRGILLGLGANAEQWGQLAEVARFRARAMGIDTTQALNDITTGIGRESRMILDNLGIILDVDAVTQQYAATLGKTADQLTAMERKQAIINSVIAEGQREIQAAGGIADNAADQFARLDKAAGELKTALGVALAPAAAETAHGLAEAVSAGPGAIGILTGLTHGALKAAGAWVTGKDAGEAFRKEIIKHDKALETTIAQTNAARIAAIQLKHAWEGMATGANTAKTATSGLGKMLAAVTGLSKSIVDFIPDMAVEILGKGADKREQMRGQFIDTWIDGLYEVDAAAEKTGRTVDEALEAAKHRAEEFRSEVEGLFQFSMSVETTDILDQMGFHKDTWDEWMRRAASVMNEGAGNQWFQPLMNSFPKFAELVSSMGDPKAAAAEFIRQFQLGFVPEAINVDAIVKAYGEQLASKEAWDNIYSQAEAAIQAKFGGVDQSLLSSLTGAPLSDQVFGNLETGFGDVGGAAGDVKTQINNINTAAGTTLPGVTKSLEGARDATKQWHDKLQEVLSDLGKFAGLGFLVSISGGATPAAAAPAGTATAGTTGPGAVVATGTGGGGTTGVSVASIVVNADENFRGALNRVGIRI